MAINYEMLAILFIISFIPFVILGIADWMTRFYRKRLQRGEIDFELTKIPFLVRMRMFSVRTLPNCVLIHYSAYAFLFGLPLIAVFILWPMDFYNFLNEISFWMILLGIFVFLEIGCKCPDPTGGLESTISSSEENKHSEDVRNLMKQGNMEGDKN